ncbi:MAG: hypothetical protein WCW26_01705 [Candidatus Buchananbacteria bacterium]
MSKKIIFCSLILSLGILLFLPVKIWAYTTSTNYVIWADVFNSGGTEDSSSTSYGLQDSIGESVILSNTSTSASYGLKAGFREMYPDEYITFSVSATALNLGTLSTAAASSGSHTMTVDTNAANGFAVTMSGTTLTSGVNTISAIGAVAAASAPGSSQFGINLAANTVPAVGADPTGTAPIGSAVSPYNSTNFFAFNSGDTVASAAVLTNQTVFTVSYLANISSAVAAGAYSTTLTYSATANF